MSFMMLLVTMMVSSAVVASSLMARYTICRNALWSTKVRVWSCQEQKSKESTDVLVLEELGGAKEQCRRLLRSKRFSDVEQIYHASEERSAFPGVDG